MVAVVLLIVVGSLFSQDQPAKKSSKKSSEAVSFKKNIFPIIEKQCLPCHAEENFNPSELSLDTYDLFVAGGKHGAPFVPGKSKESVVVQKLSADPPFGDRMPLNTKKKISEGKAKWLTDEEIKTIARWIDQGARDN
jgi:uncharacterized membrane protein